MNNLTEKKLRDLYLIDKKSVADIAKIFKCSERGINYWFQKYNIPKRTISEAVYIKCNPDGDPFHLKSELSGEEKELKSLGLGLYWGEGDKSPNNTSVRLSNTDLFLLKKFREFLRKIYNVKEEKIKYGLILFNDVRENIAVNYWKKHLGIKRKQLGKVTIVPPQGKGTYKRKSKYGVLIIIFSNKKLKEQILNDIKNFCD